MHQLIFIYSAGIWLTTNWTTPPSWRFAICPIWQKCKCSLG